MLDAVFNLSRFGAGFITFASTLQFFCASDGDLISTLAQFRQ